MNIRKFYSFFKENTKIIFIFLIIVLIHFILIYSLQQRAEVGKSLKSLHQVSHRFQAVIGNNLMNDCNFFKNRDLQTSLEYDLSRLGLEYKAQLRQLYTLGKVSFYEVNFEVSSPSDPLLFVKSSGYLVENTESLNCFGIL